MRARRRIPGVLERIPDGAVVLLDGLIASPAPEALVPQARRLRQVVLVHMPLGRTRASATVLAAAAAVVTTSAWTRRRLRELYGLPADRMHVAEPGVDAAGLAPGTAAGDALLCVAAVTPGKGHDVLLDGLATAADLSWSCACVGSLDRDPAFADGVRRRARDDGLGDRVRFPGPRTGPELDRAYAAADLLVLASRAETYGMVVTEALARGVPVLAADVGGVDRGARARRRRHPAGAARPARRPGGARRRAARAGSATPSCAAACAGPPGSGARRCAGGRPPTSVLAGVARGGGVDERDAVRVSPEWLELREPADAAARSAELAARLARHLPAAVRS